MPIPLPYPLSFNPRGLLSLLDEDDKLRGLFGLFGADATGEKTPSADDDASPAGDGAPQQAATPSVANDLPEDSTLDYVRRQARLALWGIGTLGTGGITRNPLTGEIYISKFATRLGDRMSDIAAALPLPGGVVPPGPRVMRPVTTLSRPGLLFGPGAETIGRPQVEEAGNPVYRLPPEDASEEDDDDAWKIVCEEGLARESKRCAEQYGYDARDRRACEERAFEQYQRCLRENWDGPQQWGDADVNGGWRPKTPYEKRRERWKRPRAKPG